MKLFAICFLIVFSVVVVASSIAPPPMSSEWLVVCCVAAALLGTLLARRFRPAPSATDEFEFEIVTDEYQELPQ